MYNNKDSFEQFKKLKFYLQNTDRGFILLNANEHMIHDQLLSVIENVRPFKIYQMAEIDFRDILNDLKIMEQERGLIFCFNGMTDESLPLLLEKINLARDLFLNQSRFYIFIAPFFICRMIQQDYPNLYSYFVLKEEYSLEYPMFFEYILPGKRYLITKENQRKAKMFYSNDRENLDERLEYFLVTKARTKDIIHLFVDVSKKCDEIAKNMQEETTEYADHHDFRYLFELIFKLAKVMTAQGDYDNALRIYMGFPQIDLLKVKYPGLYYERLVGIGDVMFSQELYEKALEYYSQVIVSLAEKDDYEFYEQTNRFLIKMYSRMAFCFSKLKQTEESFQYMETMMEIIRSNDELKTEDFFDVYYNYCLMLLNDRPEACRQIEDTLDIIKKLKKSIVQKAMYLSIYAWYKGVVLGDTLKALKVSKVALSLKRNYFIENDIRIAESHYVNSILYLYVGEYEKAKYCCGKCLNIFKNYRYKKDLHVITENLKNVILKRLENES